MTLNVRKRPFPARAVSRDSEPLDGRAAAQAWLAARHGAATVAGVLVALEKADYAEAAWLHELEASRGAVTSLSCPPPHPPPISFCIEDYE
jgi:hypothetical protein